MMHMLHLLTRLLLLKSSLITNTTVNTHMINFPCLYTPPSICMGGASCKTLVEQFTTLPDIISQEMNLFDVINAFAVLHFAIISKLCWHTP